MESSNLSKALNDMNIDNHNRICCLKKVHKNNCKNSNVSDDDSKLDVKATNYKHQGFYNHI